MILEAFITRKLFISPHSLIDNLYLAKTDNHLIIIWNKKQTNALNFILSESQIK
jgi:hypothetical protein